MDGGPRSMQALIRFGEVHHPLWEADPPSVGLDSKRVQRWWDAVKVARQRLAEAQAARQAAAAATVALRGAVEQLQRETGAITAQVRAFAGYGGLEGDTPDAVLARAGLDPYRKTGPKRRRG